MHPASVNFNAGRFENPWLIYTDLTETSKVFCREASMVPVYSLLLFCGDITVDHQASLLKLDGWATFKAPARVAVLVRPSPSFVSIGVHILMANALQRSCWCTEVEWQRR